MTKNRTCCFCGKKYSYCPNCDRDYLKPAYMIMFCSEECKELDHIISEHVHGRLSDIEAKEKISKFNYRKILKDNDANLAYVEKIMKKNSDKKNEEKLKDNPINKIKDKIKK